MQRSKINGMIRRCRNWMLASGMMTSALVVAPPSVQAEILPPPKVGLSVIYDIALDATGQAARKAQSAYNAVVTCRRGPYTRIDRTTKTARGLVRSRSVFYRMMVPVMIHSVLTPGGQTSTQRLSFPREVIDGYVAGGGAKVARFPVTVSVAGAKASQTAQAEFAPVGKEKITVPAGSFDTVVYRSRWTFKNMNGRNLNLDIETRAWVAEKIGYAVRIVSTQTFSGSLTRKVARDFIAREIKQVAPPADGCDGVPAK